MMKIASWNLNGIRRFSGGKLKKVFDDIDADIFCIQETKLPREAITEDVAIIDGYNSYFAFCEEGRKGYSGVATFCKDTCRPLRALDHLSSPESDVPLGDVAVDGEGRTIITEFFLKYVEDKSLGIIPPSEDATTKNTIRFEYKMRHHALLEARVQWYKENGYRVIVSGDLNVAHRKIDHCEAHLIPYFDAQPHRLWLSKFLGKGYVDSFRHFYPSKERAYTVWNQRTGARATNYGTRIDYFIADKELFDLGVFSDCRLLTDYLGSDHCPLVLDFNENWVIESATEIPALCTKYFDKFRSTQKSIDSFFVQRVPSILPKSKNIQKKANGSRQLQLSSFLIRQTVTNDSAEADAGPSEVAHTVERLTYNASSTTLETPIKSSPKPKIDFLTRKNNVPKCIHGEPAVEKVVKKKGPNYNRRFYTCGRPQGFFGDKNARCNYFQWA